MNYKLRATIALLPLVSLALSLHSQTQTLGIPPAIAWQESLGGSDDDIGTCIKPTSDGGFIVTGSTASKNGDIDANHGMKDFFLIKLDKGGQLKWEHSYGGDLMDEASAVVQTWDGGYAVVGKSSSNNGDVTGNHGSSDYWLIKTDSDGVLQWEKSYGGSDSDLPNSMQLTSDSGFVIIGITYSNDEDVEVSYGLGDIWIIKVDKNGKLQWQKTMGGSDFETGNDIQQTTDGGYIATGYTISSDMDVTYNHGQEDIWYFKLDALGNLLWQKTMGGSGGDCGSAVQQTLDGGYVICGLSHSRDFDITDSHGAHDMWIIKTDSYGQAQWTRSFGGSDGDDGIDIKQRTDGTFIACAYTSSNDDQVSGNHGLYDIWLVAISLTGDLIWQKALGGTRDDYPHNLQITPTGQYVVVGNTLSYNGDVTSNHGDFDAWVVTLESECTSLFYADADGDGYGAHNAAITACSKPFGYVADSTDCNDNKSTVYPGAVEICNNSLDDNCNGQVDENCTVYTYYADQDGDVYGNPNNSITSYNPIPPSGYVVDNTDCNDNNAAIHTPQLFYIDSDEDGFGSLSTAMLCKSITPAGYSTNHNDCNDADPAIHPNVSEVCNGLDDDCNNLIDDGLTFTTYYTDADQDGFGLTSDPGTLMCSNPGVGYSKFNTDCNDNNSTIHPGSSEVCNGIDDDCNNLVDDGLTFITYYTDADQDGFGLTSDPGTVMCSNPGVGYSILNTDCDDNNAAINPYALEICNTVDDNCNGQIDETCTTFTYYADQDSDTYGDANNTIASFNSVAPSGFVVDNTDCNDNDASVHTPQLFYIDSDGDGYGSLSSTLLCNSVEPLGYSFNNTDCNDVNSFVHPNANEVCNGLDDDCNASIDDGLAFITYYTDADQDGFGSSSDPGVLMCSNPGAGYSILNTDCDDNNATINPDALEICNAVDDDCNGQIDETCATFTYYADQDSDTYGDANNTITSFNSSAPTGFVVDNTDCNDNDASVHTPQLFYIDSDGDGYGSLTSEMFCSSISPVGYSFNNTDCNDVNSFVHPNAIEICNGLDDDCNNIADDGLTFITYYTDADQDGFGSSSVSGTSMCSNPGVGYSTSHADCDDNNPIIHPGAHEICNGLDDDCNNLVDDGLPITTYYPDADHDGFGSSSLPGILMCNNPGFGYSILNTDCDDNNSQVNPNAIETCNSIDDDCNNQIDETTVTAIVTPSGEATVCAGNSVTLSANSAPGFTYQWKKNGAIIPHATNSTYEAKVAASYKVKISSGSCYANSSGTIVTVLPLPSATITPSGIISKCPEAPLTLEANSGSGLTYQWQRNNVSLAGVTDVNYITSSAGSYKVIVTDGSGCLKPSSSAVLSNYQGATAKIYYTGNLNICVTGSVTLSAKVISGYSYQWFKNNNLLNGATETSYTATEGGTYTYQATTSDGCSSFAPNKVVKSCKLENNDEVISLSVYPNPTTGNFNVELQLENAEDGSAKIELINMMGEVVFAEDATVTEGILRSDVNLKNDVPNGLYFVKITAGDYVTFQRITFQR